MRKKVLSVLLCTAMGISLLTGCGGKTEDPKSGENTETASKEALGSKVEKETSTETKTKNFGEKTEKKTEEMGTANEEAGATKGTGSSTKFSSEAFGSKKGEEINVLVMPKVIGLPFYDRGEIGGGEAEKDFNMKVTFDGPTNADAATQVTMLENYIAAGNIDVICVAPNDPDTLAPVLEEAREAGIMVQYFDSMANDEDIDCGVSPCTTETVATSFWDTMVEIMGTDKGDYIVFTGGANAANLNTWIAAGEEYAKTAYPGLNEVTAAIATEESTETAYEKAAEALKAYPDLKGIICMSSATGPGVAQAVKEAGKEDAIALVTMTTPNAISEYLKDKSVDMNIIWDCAQMVYANCFMARMFFDGENVADGMSPVSCAADGTGTIAASMNNIEVDTSGLHITLGAPLIMNADNVSNWDY